MRAADTKKADASASDKAWPPPALDTWMIETELSPDTEWLLNRLLPRDAIVLISGRAKRARKSLFTMLLVRAILEGKPELLGPSWRVMGAGTEVLGSGVEGAESTLAAVPPSSQSAIATVGSSAAIRPTSPLYAAGDGAPESSQQSRRPIRALVVAYEGPAKATAKLWRWLSGTKPGTPAPEWMGRVRWAHRYSDIKLNDAVWVDKLCAYVREQGFTLVIIDTFRRALMGNEKDDENVSVAIDALEKIRTATNGGAVIFVHHIRKPPPKNTDGKGESAGVEEDFDDEVRGSTAIPGAYDHHLAVRTSYDQKALWLYTRGKIDEDRFFRLDWKIEDGAASCAVTEWTAPLDSAQLAELYDVAPKAGKLKDFARSWNLPFSVTESAIEQLELAGFIREANGKYLKEE